MDLLEGEEREETRNSERSPEQGAFEGRGSGTGIDIRGKLPIFCKHFKTPFHICWAPIIIPNNG
jgi:hypothetical protein